MHSNRFHWCGAAALVGFLIGVVLPVAAQEHVHYRRFELRRMMREAVTADQYRILATWFREEEVMLRCKSEAENRDYEQYKTLVRIKVPTRADNARSLRDYYSSKADNMSKLAARYEMELSRVDPTYRPTTEPASSRAGAPGTANPCHESPNGKTLLDKTQRLEQQTPEPRKR